MNHNSARLLHLENIVETLTNKLSRLSSLAALHLSENRRALSSGINYNGVFPADHGDTAFMILCSVLVMMMTIPGLGLYYAGMVRIQNVLATVMQSFSIACIITLMWMFWGYSLVFGPAGMPDSGGNVRHSSPFIGDGSRLWLWGINVGSFHQLAPTIPESVFCVYQLAFAIITASLISGSFADKMNFGPMLIFMSLWHTAVYCPIAHWNWHPDGFLAKAGTLDFAGGNVVHIASGISGFMCTLAIGNRKGFGKERFEPHNTLLTFFGTCLLWVGWYGFNAGSAFTAGSIAGVAMLNTQIATAVAALSWLCTEWYVRKRPSLLGILSGAVAGLVAITPAAGFVDPTGAFCIGVIAGPFCYFGAQMKHRLGFDDALDGFGIHSIGGICGGFLIGFFATDRFSHKSKGILYGGGGMQLALQLYGITVTCAWSAVVSYTLLFLMQKAFNLHTDYLDEDNNALDYSIRPDVIVLADRGDLTQSRRDLLYGRPSHDLAAPAEDPHIGNLDNNTHGDYYSTDTLKL